MFSKMMTLDQFSESFGVKIDIIKKKLNILSTKMKKRRVTLIISKNINILNYKCKDIQIFSPSL